MIRSVEAINFKCLSDEPVRFNMLTVLTGTNSVGKSSVLQTLLLARSAALAATAGERVIPLNGLHGLELGRFTDILRHDASKTTGTTIKFRIVGNESTHELMLAAESEESRYAAFEFFQGPPSDLLGPLIGNFTYLAAEREGTRDSSAIQSAPKERMRIGARGQHVADVLAVYERDPVGAKMEHKSASGQRLLKQAEAWLSEFVPNVEIRVEAVPEFDVAALRFKRGGVSAEWERPRNTGFGVSYSLPIVVAALVARPGSLLLIENPEAHLHPSAQSRMGLFLTQLANYGVQVIIETHSDHILNGIRLATVSDETKILKDKVVINHLSRSKGGMKLEEITIDNDGALSSRPDDFFDQTEKDLGAIVQRRLNIAAKQK